MQTKDIIGGGFPLKILHTSDWHLGRTLEGKSRIPEQKDFIDELCNILDKEEVHLVIIAGDVFDNYNPSAAAEELFYEALERISDHGRRGVVAIAGNHDSPERLRAANPIAHKHGIYLFGLPGEDAGPMAISNRAYDEIAATREDVLKDEKVKAVDGGVGWIELDIPGCDENAIILALPYPSEKRLNEVLSISMKEVDLQRAYSDRVALALEEGSQYFRDDTVNIITSHLYILGGINSDSERNIQLGGAFIVEPKAIPSKADYTALGHLHRPQRVGGTSSPCYYSGSPLYYSFSESNQKKQVLVTEIIPQEKNEVKPIPLKSGKPMYIKRFPSYKEAYDWCSAEENQDIWLHIEINLEEPLSNAQLEELNNIHKGIIYRRMILPGVQEEEKEGQSLQELSLEEQFQRFVAQETGAAPSQKLKDLFLELLQEGDEDEAN